MTTICGKHHAPETLQCSVWHCVRVFLSELFGEPPLFMAMDYTQTDPGFPGISLHCDGQPWGIAEQFGKEFSSPRFLKCLYALDDTTEDVSAFKVVPRSHLSFHADANPYQRYEEHPECVKVLMNAGDCVVFSGGVFHGNFPHTGDRPRRVLAVRCRARHAAHGLLRRAAGAVLRGVPQGSVAGREHRGEVQAALVEQR